MHLSDQQRRLTRLFTAAVLGEWGEVRALRRAAPDGEPDRAWREAVLQVHLFAGFPRLVETLGVLAEEGGLGEPLPEELEGSAPHPQRGDELFERIYGDGSERVRAMLRAGHGDFATWVAEHAYARVLARPGLSAARRELLACCALAALGQDRQLASHARGSVRCGASHAELVESLELVADLLGPERLERARHIAARFAAE
jgi:alkylhydroperoxidase/carboxymuconolactone decarboxylase family protein YurZ